MINIRKLKKILSLSLLKTFIFNFTYLPFKQAIKLPVFLYNTELNCIKGKIVLDMPSKLIKPGIIQIGYRGTPIFNKEKSIWRNKGIVFFKGLCHLGSGSAICCYPGATLTFGEDFVATARLKIECFEKIEFGKHNRIAWECIVMDSSQHRIKNIDGTYAGKDTVPIETGSNVWIGSRALLLKGTKLPNYCILAAGTITTKDYRNYGSKIILAADNYIKIKRNDVWIDPEDSRDSIASEYWNKG